MFKKIAEVIFPLLIFLLCSCATTLKTSVERPSELDVGAAKTISVISKTKAKNSFGVDLTFDILDFLFDDKIGYASNYDYKDISNYVDKQFAKSIKNAEIFDYKGAVDSSDILILWKIDHLDVSVQKNEYKEKVDGKEVKKIEYTTHADINLSYSILNAEGEKLYSDSLYYSESSTSGTKQSPKSVLLGNLDSFVIVVLKKVQPYSVKLSYRLIDLKTKSEEEKAAKKYAKKSDYKAAAAFYKKYYEDTSIAESACNYAVLCILMKNYDDAKVILSPLVEEGNSHAVYTMELVERESNFDKKLLEQNNLRNGSES